MVERIRLSPECKDDDGSGFLQMYLRECIYLNTDDDSRYLLPKPYEYADIRQRMINPEEVLPTAKYVLRGNLARIEALDRELSAEGIDIFNLRGVVKIRENLFIGPPILEVWEHEPYNRKPVIVDGGHRFYIAKQRGIWMNSVLISGNISSDLPVLPLAGWHEVVLRDTVPEDKRNYHPGIPAPWKPHELYRVRFHGSTGPRVVNTA